MYDYFKQLLDTAEDIGKVSAAELSDYNDGWIDITGTLESGKGFKISMRLEDK